MTESTAVARSDTQNGEASVEEIARNAPTREAIEQIRQGGALAVEKKRELNKLERQLQGMEWGNVQGSQFSPQTRYALAELIYITRANPQLHIDVLGGKPYLNANYWTDLANSHDHFIGYELTNLDAGHIDLLRQQALEVEQELHKLKEESAEELASEIADLRREAMRLKAQAREAERQRAHYGVPDIALAAYEVHVQRYRPGAPIGRIVSGEIDDDSFVQDIYEANWAPNSKNDPVGREHPHNTARTRAVRRGFVKAFSAWMEPLEEDIQRLENAIEAEYTIIRDDDRQESAALPAGDEPQAARSGGEATAASSNGAEAVPTRDVDDEGSAQDPESELEESRARAREKFEAGLEAAGLEPIDAYDEVLDGREPENLQDYTDLNAWISGLLDAEAAEDEPGLGLGG